MKVKCIDAENDKNITLGKVYEVLSEEFSKIRSVRGYKIINDIGEEVVYGENKFNIIEEVNDIKELTFREVIANIKEGEIWESPEKLIKQLDGEISVTKRIKTPFNSTAVVFNNDKKYKLVKQEYSFQEAFEALENGKEIESCVSGYCMYKDFNEYVVFISKERNDYYSGEESIFSAEEVKGKWYINE